MSVKFRNLIIENKELLKKALKLPFSNDDNDNTDMDKWFFNMDKRLEKDLQLFDYEQK